MTDFLDATISKGEPTTRMMALPVIVTTQVGVGSAGKKRWSYIRVEAGSTNDLDLTYAAVHTIIGKIVMNKTPLNCWPIKVTGTVKGVYVYLELVFPQDERELEAALRLLAAVTQ